MTAAEKPTDPARRMANLKAAAQPDHGVSGLSKEMDAYLHRLISLSPGHDGEEECRKLSLCDCLEAVDTPGGEYKGRKWLIDNLCGQVEALITRVQADRIRNALKYERYTPEPGFREEVLRQFLWLYAGGHMGRMSAWRKLLEELNVIGEERTRLVELVLRGMNGLEAPALMRWPHGKEHPRMHGAPGTVCDGEACGGRTTPFTEQMRAVFDADYWAIVAKDDIYAVPRRGRNAHRATMAVEDKAMSGFGARIARAGYEKLGRQPNPSQIAALAANIRGDALLELDARGEIADTLPVRATPFRDGYLIDLANHNKYVFVNADGWWVTKWREDFPTMLATNRALPIPVKPEIGPDPRLGHLGFDEHDPNWHQIRMWQATVFFADHERQMMLLTGDSGSGKSKRAESIAWIVDPLETTPDGDPVMGGPLPDDEALGPMLLRNFLFTSDNLTAMTQEDSDRLCRIGTGYTFIRRVLYTTSDLYTVTVRRPGLLTGINVPTGLAEDAQNRMLHLHLDSNAPKRPSREIADERVALGPVMLGALLNDMVVVLKAYKAGEYRRHERFPVVWAAAQAFGEEYMATLENSKRELARQRASGDTLLREVAKVVKYAGVPLGEGRYVLDLTGSELMDALLGTLVPGTPRPKGWPTSPQGLTRRFRTNRDTVKAFGLELEDIRTSKERRQRIFYVEGTETVEIPDPPTPKSQTSAMYPDERKFVRGPFRGPEADTLWERVRDRTEKRLRADGVDATEPSW